MGPRRSAIRVEFSKEHDTYLYKYLASYCPAKEGRRGQKVFQRLIANEDNIWPWSVHHTWQSWRERYVKNTDRFDALILNYQRKHNIKLTGESKRAAEPMPIEMLRPSAKRVKLEAEKAHSSEKCTEEDAVAQHASSSSSSSESKSIPKRPREPQEAPSQAHPPREREPTDVPPSSLPHYNTDATKKPSLDLPVRQTRDETLEIPSSTPNQPASLPADDEPEPHSSPCAMRRIKKRHRTPSEVFASEPSSPRRDPAVADVGGAPVTDTVYLHALPRAVDSLHEQALVNQKRHLSRVFPHGEGNGAEQEKEEEANTQWPPPRGRTVKQRTVSGLGVEVDAHHAFSQPQPRPKAQEGIALVEREQGEPHHPFGRVSRSSDEALLDRRTAGALFSAKPRHGVAPQVESERREDTIQNGVSPVKHIVPSTPAPLYGLPPSTASISPVPRTSTQSPFRPDPPAEESHHPAPRPRSRTKAARHPALSRRRRQTTDRNPTGNGHEHDNGRGREHEQVPSVDLVALSRSSTSMQSHSRSSADTSIPAKPSRWSLPLFAHATPWMIDEPEAAPSAPGSMLVSGSGSPFKWVAPAPVFADILGHARTSSLGETSTPRLMFTPSPARSNAPLPTAIPTSRSLSFSPHPFDVPLAASHGLASILAHMSANHGLALNVVEAVYTRVRNLRETDEVLMGMRKAAEGFGEREIEKRTRRQYEEQRGGRVGYEERNGVGQRGRGHNVGKGQKRTMLRYVAASEDGEGSEYSPPETSRAAMWKQQSESASDVKEGGEGESRDDEEEEEGRVVEEELLEEGEGENGDENGLLDPPRAFSQALMEDMRAQELEGRVGRAKFHRDIVKQFL